MWNGLDLDEAVWSVHQTCMGNAGVQRRLGKILTRWWIGMDSGY